MAQHEAVHELLIRVETGVHCQQLEAFLRDRCVQSRPKDEHSLAVNLDEHGSPALATLVAAVEEWRGRAHAGEIVLELEGETRILRTET